ncbi:hypothetical protein [Pseudanabaena mucicola]|uniref:Uncharacterized protein n=1 Tax=Pseudanabaena mucicola FACHB-723 TaxID=2692860 RepID=A0ABR8A0G8_9CYAN|nr:hypothetical protein [Pseudanabaena mucicola]MBD2189698.1 hypothetical protein [Pseudanabaena mucicola FACHB-723]
MEGTNLWAFIAAASYVKPQIELRREAPQLYLGLCLNLLGYSYISDFDAQTG